MGWKSIIKRLVFGYRGTSEAYIAKLRKLGAIIGDDVTIHVPQSTTIDITAPWLLSIGNHVNITGPATILTHDYSWSVIKGMTGEILGNERPVSIGDNVFIGWGATLLAGSCVPNNVIIGAHSVVTGRLEANSVYGGIPARKICSVEEYREKRLGSQLKEATEFYNFYKERRGAPPKEEEFFEYFMLFSSGDLAPRFDYQVQLMGTGKKTKELLESGLQRRFSSYEMFCNYCLNK